MKRTLSSAQTTVPPETLTDPNGLEENLPDPSWIEESFREPHRLAYFYFDDCLASLSL